MTALDLALREYLDRRSGSRAPLLPDDSPRRPWTDRLLRSPERQPCCEALAARLAESPRGGRPSRAVPAHLRSPEHIAALYGVPLADLLAAIRSGRRPAPPDTSTAPVIAWRVWRLSPDGGCTASRPHTPTADTG
jgi:hypothetical protein